MWKLILLWHYEHVLTLFVMAIIFILLSLLYSYHDIFSINIFLSVKQKLHSLSSIEAAINATNISKIVKIEQKTSNYLSGTFLVLCPSSAPVRL